MADALFKIPLQNLPQRFEIDLSGRTIRMTSVWNPEMPAWFITMVDAVTGEELVNNYPLVTGADLLEQYAYLEFKAAMFVYVEGGQDTDAIPDLDTLGNEANLYYYVP